MARTVRGTGTDDRATSQNLDAVGIAVGDIPETYYTEGNLITVTFSAPFGLDQTLPHKLSGACKAEVVDVKVTGGTPAYVARSSVSSPRTDREFVRVVANASCVATIWCWR